jgi:hypothetical protein
MTFIARNTRHQRGDISIYLALTIITIMISSALLLSVILITQLRSTEDIVESERAFYAANSGLERAFYELSLFATPGPIPLNETLSYGDNIPQAAFDGQAGYAADGITPCVAVSGGYPVRDGQTYPGNAPQAQERRLSVGPADCLP